mmetsp:Transcript_12909/g.23264  ORF Transcript_12909/g.23264 Transcript_12909/m.23264 type:complete len:384 (-) Transcript_12909:816-1967(-)
MSWLRFWLTRLVFVLRNYDHPIQLRLMEFFGHVVFMLCGMNGGMPNERCAKALVAREKKFSRRLWNIFHSLIDTPARFEPKLEVFSTDVRMNAKCKVRIFRPSASRLYDMQQDGRNARLVVFFHGGGFVLNSCSTQTHHIFCERLAARGFCVLSVDYRLAPEHKFPDGLEDCYNSLLWVTQFGTRYLPQGMDTKRIILAGDSAGGNFVATISALVRDGLGVNLKPCNKIKDSGLEIVHQVIMYGAFFVDPPPPSMQALLDGKQYSFLNVRTVKFFLEAYLPEYEEAKMDRRAAPMVAGCHGLPRTTVFSADCPLKDENILYVTKIRDAGGDCSHFHYDHVHGYLTFDFLDISETALNELVKDIGYLQNTKPMNQVPPVGLHLR